MGRRAAKRQDDDGPTAETWARLETVTAERGAPDAIDALYRKGLLRHYHVVAADEIETIYLALCRCPASRYDARSSAKTYTSPVERLSRSEERLWRYRYGPWASRVGPNLAVVIRAKVDNVYPSPSEIPILRDCLQTYAQLAGLTHRKRFAPS